MERNSDIIKMQCYAPLLVNVNPGARQWRPDLIGYDALSAYGSPSYYAIQMFSRNLGDEILSVTPSETSVQGCATRDSKTGEIIVKLVNPELTPQSLPIEIKGVTVARIEGHGDHARGKSGGHQFDQPSEKRRARHHDAARYQTRFHLHASGHQHRGHQAKGALKKSDTGKICPNMTGKIHMKKISCLALGLAAFFAAMNLSVAATNETPRLISADLQQTNGPLDTMFKFCVGAGRANEGLRADWQRQLTYAHRECGFEYIRMHGLFDDDMGVYREDSNGNPEYNWQYIDELYDFLQSIGMKPFVELGFMPNALASGSKTIFWYHGNVTPPKDMKKWGDFIQRLCHALEGTLRRRRGADVVFRGLERTELARLF